MYKFKKKNYQIIEVKNGWNSVLGSLYVKDTLCIANVSPSRSDSDRRQNRVSYVYWRYNKTAELSVSQSLRRHVLDICFPLIKPSGENRATGISGGGGRKFSRIGEKFLEKGCP